MQSRETIYAALFALLTPLQTAGTVRLCDRRPRFLDQMAPSELPAVLMTMDHQTVTRRSGQPPRYQLSARIYVYAAATDPHQSASMALNGLLDAVEQAFLPQANDLHQTLGGLVADVVLDGKIEIYESPLGERAAAIMPITLLTA